MSSVWHVQYDITSPQRATELPNARPTRNQLGFVKSAFVEVKAERVIARSLQKKIKYKSRNYIQLKLHLHSSVMDKYDKPLQ